MHDVVLQAVGALDGKVFAEIKSFKEPPDQIYLVMKVHMLIEARVVLP